MPDVRAFVASMLIGFVLPGCAAMFVPATSDPDQKIRDAAMLYDQQQRPLPAERLIREAIEIYRERKNDLGLAEAYRNYGFFFRSSAVKKLHKHYQSNGFMEKDATYETRYEKSISYFEKSATILEKYQKHDVLSNIYLNMGFTYEFANQPEKACDEYKKTLMSNQRNLKVNPEAKASLPEGYSTFEAYVTAIMERLKCAT